MLKMFMVSLVLAGFSAFPAPWDARADIGPAAENVLVASVPQTESSDEEKATFDGEAAEIKENEEKPAPSKTEAGSASDERGNAALSAQLAEREADLARREAALAEREADLVKQDKASSASSVEVAEREAELAKREAALAEREAELANQGKSASASSAELAAREAELAKRESALTTREAELANQDKVSIASSAELAEREAAMKDKEAALTARETELERQSKASSESSAELAAREEDLKKREAALAEKREADLAEREAELKKKEAALTEKEAALQNKEIALMDKAPVVAEAPIAVPDVNGPGAVVVKKENGLMNWTENYIEATGMAVAPTGMKGAQGKALARRGATLDLQRNLLEFMKGVQIDAQTTMNDFMAEDRVRSEISGIIKNVEVMRGEWDGEAYTVTGRIKLPPVRAVVAPKIPVDKTYKEPKPKKSAGRYTGLVIDARHLPLVPSMSFRVLDESGKPVYGMEFVDYDRFLQSGLCAYYNNINYAKGEVHVAGNPIVAKALKLKNGNVDIVVSNAVAAKVRGSSYDFRKDCKVIVVSK
ncbi:hypothetical protein [uncultured Fretibacterium sp.]|uniref:hypothetical protein n=1 Tax=uncultured Fretibacterium sp. TaxID=1678694 RepID=UPI0026028C5F|nr:hypothetical protein [uncultured Fretibacterium sp.]